MFNNLYRPGLLILALIYMPLYARFYTLDQLIEETIKNSVTLKIAKKEIDYTEIKIQKVKSRFYPRISSSINAAYLFERSTAKSFYFEDGPGIVLSTTGMSETVKKDQEANTSSMPIENDVSEFIIPSVKIHQTLFAQGKEYYKIKSGRAIQHIKVCQYEQIKQQEIAETKKWYYKVLLEQERIDVLRQHLSILKEIHRQKRLGISLGENEASDTLFSRLEVQNGILKLLEAKSDKNMALEALTIQCGITDKPSSLWFDGKIPEPVFFISIEEAVTQMYEMNSTMRQFKGYENVARNKVALNKFGYLPKIGMGAFVGRGYPVVNRNGQFKVLDSENVSVLYAQLQWDLFAGLETKRNVELAKNELDRFQLKERKGADSLELETRRQYYEISLAKKKLVLIQKIIKTSEKVLAEEKIKFANGIVTALEVQVAEYALQKEKLRYMEQLYQFHCDLIDFRFLIGSPV